VRPRDADQELVGPRTIWQRAQVASHSIDISDLGVGQADKTDPMDVLQHVARFASELVPVVLAIEVSDGLGSTTRWVRTGSPLGTSAGGRVTPVYSHRQQIAGVAL